MPYDNPKGLIAASVILEILAITCVGFRFLSRRKTGASFATDDWLILVALVCSSGLTVMEIYGKLTINPYLLQGLDEILVRYGCEKL